MVCGAEYSTQVPLLFQQSCYVCDLAFALGVSVPGTDAQDPAPSMHFLGNPWGGKSTEACAGRVGTGAETAGQWQDRFITPTFE